MTASKGTVKKKQSTSSASKGKRTSSASGKKSTGSRSSARSSSGKNKVSRSAGSRSGRASSARQVSRSKADPVKKQRYTEPVDDEIRLIIVLTICVLLMLSIFNLGGSLGSRVAYGLFGIFGFMTYFLPFALFFGLAFHMVNRHSRLAAIKLAAATALLIIICALIACSKLATGNIETVKDSFLVCAASHAGGGLVGNIIALPLYAALGRVGTTVILVCLLLIAGVLITGRSLFLRLGSLLGDVKNDVSVRAAESHERHVQERERAREERRAARDDYEDIDGDEEDDEDEAYDSNEASGHHSIFASFGRKISGSLVGDGIDDDLEEDFIEASVSPAADQKQEISEESYYDALAAQAVSASAAALEDEEEDFSSLSDESAAEEEVDASDLLAQINAGRVNTDGHMKKSEDGKPLKPAFIRQELLDEHDKGTRMEPVRHVDVPSFLKKSREDKGGRSEVKERRTGSSSLVQTLPVSSGSDRSEDGSGLTDQTDISENSEAAVVKTARRKPVRKTAAMEEEVLQQSADVARQINEGESKPAPAYVFPPIELLEKGGAQAVAREDQLAQTAKKLQATFDSFGVGVKVTDVSCGPTVTRYEIQPDVGVKVNRIVSLADDIKLNLAAADIRIEAPIPGKAAVGIEVPNEIKQMVRLRDLIESKAFRSLNAKMAFAAGKDIAGQVVMGNIEKMPHLLIAGATGSGKSVCINTIIISILYRAAPDEVKMLMIDPKVVELSVYNGLPHLLIPVVTDPKKAAGALNWAVNTMMERYRSFEALGAKDIKSFNERVDRMPEGTTEFRHMSHILIVIDELADLMMVARGEVEDAIVRLTQLARAAGIHLIIATQRPSVNVITGLIKANVPSRIAFSVSSGVDSRTILDMVGAEKLLGNGDMLFYPQGYTKPVRVQGAFVSEEEIGRVTDYIKAQLPEQVSYDEELTEKIVSTASTAASPGASSDDQPDRDELFEEAGRFVIEKEKASIGMLQRVFKIGFNRAARIMDQLADAGVVGPETGTKPRQILMTIDEYEAFLRNQ